MPNRTNTNGPALGCRADEKGKLGRVRALRMNWLILQRQDYFLGLYLRIVGFYVNQFLEGVDSVTILQIAVG